MEGKCLYSLGRPADEEQNAEIENACNGHSEEHTETDGTKSDEKNAEGHYPSPLLFRRPEKSISEEIIVVHGSSFHSYYLLSGISIHLFARCGSFLILIHLSLSVFNDA